MGRWPLVWAVQVVTPALLAGGGGTSRNHIMFGGGVNRFLAKAVGGVPGEPEDRLQLGPTSVRDESRGKLGREEGREGDFVPEMICNVTRKCIFEISMHHHCTKVASLFSFLNHCHSYRDPVVSLLTTNNRPVGCAVVRSRCECAAEDNWSRVGQRVLGASRRCFRDDSNRTTWFKGRSSRPCRWWRCCANASHVARPIERHVHSLTSPSGASVLLSTPRPREGPCGGSSVSRLWDALRTRLVPSTCATVCGRDV